MSVANTACMALSERGPRNASWQGARSKLVVSLERHTGDNTNWLGEIPAAVAEWNRYRTVACFVTSSSPVPLKTSRVGQRYTLNLSRAETSSHWCGS
ncbi:hypothetical protein TNCV_2563381 [Trichonephila clavipes]|nr:hypothetical protein TNCV_2563381 [Trichonephila clavipes]